MTQTLRHHKNKALLGFFVFVKKLKRMVFQPIFIILTLFGNALILISSSLVYHFELGINPNIHSYLDTLWWAVSTVTTVGYGDVTPITPQGRIVGIILMVIGIAMFWSYTALFAEALLAKEIDELEHAIQKIENLVKSNKSDAQSLEALSSMISTLQKHIQNQAIKKDA